jgi:Flp pilus assembly protein TadG
MKRRKTNARRRGNAILEFALAATFLAPLFLAAFQFGLGFFYANQLTNAVRAGARYASLRPYDSATVSPSETYLKAVRNMTVYGNPAGGTIPVIAGLTAANVEVTVSMANGAPAQVRVAIRDYSMNALLKRYSSLRPEAVFPYLGVYMPGT